jgi:Tfp pilus assembly protein PilO
MIKRLVIYVTVGLVLGAVWMFVLHRPLVERRSLVAEQTRHAEAQLADYVHTIAQLPKYLQTSEALGAQRNELNSSLYAKDDILKLLDRISGVAAAHNLAVLEITPPVADLIQINTLSDLSNEPQYLDLTVDIRGQYADFGRFVSFLEKEPYFRSINDCSIRGGQTIQQELDFSIGFKALLGTSKEAG